MYPFGERWGGGAVLRGDTLTLALALSQTGRGNGSGGVSQNRHARESRLPRRYAPRNDGDDELHSLD